MSDPVPFQDPCSSLPTTIDAATFDALAAESTQARPSLHVRGERAGIDANEHGKTSITSCPRDSASIIATSAPNRSGSERYDSSHRSSISGEASIDKVLSRIHLSWAYARRLALVERAQRGLHDVWMTFSKQFPVPFSGSTNDLTGFERTKVARSPFPSTPASASFSLRADPHVGPAQPVQPSHGWFYPAFRVLMAGTQTPSFSVPGSSPSEPTFAPSPTLGTISLLPTVPMTFPTRSISFTSCCHIPSDSLYFTF
ncbi:hypothetical protein CF319_g9313 [Tilletia indica]|nr:hypothetical protein CF319_g9313 [Tilletia indica]